MIISHSNKFIWIKTRKCASSSIEIGLNSICDSNDYMNKLKENWDTQKKYISSFNELKDYGITPHEPILSVLEKSINKNILTKDQWDKYFFFTIERNPWDKVVSLHYYYQKTKYKSKNFQEFLDGDKWTKAYNWPLYTINDKIVVNKVMIYENLINEMINLSKKLNKDIILFNENSHQRPKNKKDYRELYNHRNRKLVEKFYKKEIDYFNYKFDKEG